MSDRTWGSGSSRSSDVTILLVEPNPDELTPFVESFEDTDGASEVRVVSTADGMLDAVHQRGDYADRSRPDLVLLDLHLPDADGGDLLAELKGDPELRHVPVLVLTNSDAATDVTRSYDLHANAYVRKPDDPDGFAALARAIEDFWLTVARLPP